jgi:hypothetical protein
MDKTRRKILSAFGAMLPAWLIARTSSAADGLLGSAVQSVQTPPSGLLGNRFFTFNSVVRVNQIETSRDVTNGEDESSIHSPQEAQAFRQAVEKGWPGARITWAFSWLALKDERPNYRDLKKLVVSYHKEYGDEITFIPGGYFANMYNTRAQVNRDLHDGLQMVSDMVGNGYRPQCVIAGFLAAENLRFLAEEEGIHVCQGNIWSQYSVDNGDGEGSISYPYYPSREHFCKPAQGKDDFIDCVNLDGWTVDFLSAKYPGGRDFDGMWCGSRQGVGPIANKEIRWFMNKDFRLALLKDLQTNAPEKVVDFTRYDLTTREPADPKPGQHSRNWSLMNRLNQKGVRPQDKPILFEQLNMAEQAFIKRRYPDLLKETSI